MPHVTYRCEGDQLRLLGNSVSLRIGGFWLQVANRMVTQSQFERLREENPDVEFIEVDNSHWPGPVKATHQSR